MTASSFINEHTAEYYLVPQICKMLSSSKYQAIPFYYWKTREGANMSKLSDQGNNARLIVVYARRPKVELPGQNEIIVKLNYSLFQTSVVFNEYDVPVFAGVPLASSIMELSLDTPCSWFYLNPKQIPDDDLIFSISKKRKFSDAEIEPYVKNINESNLFEIIFDKTATNTWVKWIETINIASWQIQEHNDSFNPFFQWFGIYKPFYVALFERKNY